MKYEALLIGLQVVCVLVHLDSKLVVQQVKGIFEIKDEKPQKYCEAIERNQEQFVEMHLK